MIWEERTQYAECDGCGNTPYPPGNDFNGELSELVASLEADGWIVIRETTWDLCDQWTAFCPDCVAAGALREADNAQKD